MKKIPCEVYSRVVGYFRPVSNWNDGKRAEFDDRLAFSEQVSHESEKCVSCESGEMSPEEILA